MCFYDSVKMESSSKKGGRYILSSLQMFPLTASVQDKSVKKNETKFHSSGGSEIENPRFTGGIFP